MADIIPPALIVKSPADGKPYIIGHIYTSTEGGEVIIDRHGNLQALIPKSDSRKRPKSNEITEEEATGKTSYGPTNQTSGHTNVENTLHRLREIALWLGDWAKSIETLH